MIDVDGLDAPCTDVGKKFMLTWDHTIYKPLLQILHTHAPTSITVLSLSLSLSLSQNSENQITKTESSLKKKLNRNTKIQKIIHNESSTEQSEAKARNKTSNAHQEEAPLGATSPETITDLSDSIFVSEFSSSL